MPVCECGCEQEFVRVGNKGAPRRFIPGHQFRTPAAVEARRLGKLRQRVKPPADYPTHGLCLCGCGQRTTVVRQTSGGGYAGFPRLYVHGHNPEPTGPDSPGFTGRRQTMTHKYVYLYMPEHPKASTSESMRGYVAEHRLVWEEAHGRYLTDAEIVHHINGVRDDNRPENLVALTRAAHMRGHAKERTIATRRKLSEAMKQSWAKRRRTDPSGD